MLHLDLFSGIGGFAIAAERVWPNIEHVFCEIDPFCRSILKKHWPNSTIYGDIRTVTNAKSEQAYPSEQSGLHAKPRIQNTRIDILTGGFPCQPFSSAGKRKGTGDDRHLWPEMRRVIQEFSPRYVVAENVRGLLSIDGGLVFESVCTDLEALGYEVQPFVIPACAVNAPHRRDRIWIVAYSEHEPKGNAERGRAYQGAPVGATGPDQDAPDAAGIRCDGDDAQRQGIQRPDCSCGETRTGNKQAWTDEWPTVAARLCRLDDGLPSGIPRPRGWRNAALKAYGNAIVPQVAEQIFRAIKMID